MKIRNGFVSNSSSSSFLISFKKKPLCTADIKRELWPDIDVLANPYDSFKTVPTSEAALLVWEQINGSKKISKAKMLETFENSWEACYPINWDEPHEQRRAKAKKKAPDMLKAFLDSAKGRHIYMVEFSDDSDTGSTLEHGNVFRKVPHQAFSNH